MRGLGYGGLGYWVYGIGFRVRGFGFGASVPLPHVASVERKDHITAQVQLYRDGV